MSHCTVITREHPERMALIETSFFVELKKIRPDWQVAPGVGTLHQAPIYSPKLIVLVAARGENIFAEKLATLKEGSHLQRPNQSWLCSLACICFITFCQIQVIKSSWH